MLLGHLPIRRMRKTISKKPTDLPRLPRPSCPSPRRLLPEDRRRASPRPWPVLVNDRSSPSHISFVSRWKDCIDQPMPGDQMYHSRVDPRSASYINQVRHCGSLFPFVILHHPTNVNIFTECYLEIDFLPCSKCTLTLDRLPRKHLINPSHHSDSNSFSSLLPNLQVTLFLPTSTSPLRQNLYTSSTFLTFPTFPTSQQPRPSSHNTISHPPFPTISLSHTTQIPLPEDIAALQQYLLYQSFTPTFSPLTLLLPRSPSVFSQGYAEVL
jgi:hypothetical protein